MVSANHSTTTRENIVRSKPYAFLIALTIGLSLLYGDHATAQDVTYPQKVLLNAVVLVRNPEAISVSWHGLRYSLSWNDECGIFRDGEYRMVGTIEDIRPVLEYKSSGKDKAKECPTGALFIPEPEWHSKNNAMEKEFAAIKALLRKGM